VVLCAFYTLGFVLSLYVWEESREKDGRDRDSVIKKRFISVFFVCLVALLVDLFFFDITMEELGLSLNPIATFKSSAAGLGLTAILFFGPLVQLLLQYPMIYIPDMTKLRPLRDYIIGPLAEEFAFRALMLPILLKGGFHMYTTAIFSMISFGLAHAHHFYHTPLGEVCFKLFYTSIFGAYSSFLFLRTGHIMAPLLSHSFCNYMGFPYVDKDNPNIKGIAVSYVVGIVAFGFLMMPMTDPTLHGSIFFSEKFATVQ
jgi:prenyl protein peptidase